MADNTVITIARTYGSGGRTLGQMLAKELGIHYYDQELLRRASEESGIKEELFGKADEQLKNPLLHRIVKNTYNGEFFPPDSDKFISNDNLFGYQAKVIRQIAEEESCIIIGRCADDILRNYPNVVKLYFFAAEKDCIARLMKQNGGTEAENAKKIAKIDQSRAEYYHYYTGKDWKDISNYDLCLNTGTHSYEKLIRIVKAYLEVNEIMI